MPKDFDDILKKGKQAVANINPKDEWDLCIANVLYELHLLNSLYGDIKTNHISVGQQKCHKCKKVTFVLTVRDLNDRSKAIKFHKSDWKADKDKYFCEECKD